MRWSVDPRRARRPGATALSCALFCLTFPSCALSPAIPTTAPALGPIASSQPGTSLAAGIPSAAWSHGLGLGGTAVGRPRVAYPMIDDGPWGVMPLGGLGAGTIGRTLRGDFARWHLDIGSHRFESVPANQFSLFVSDGRRTQAHVLSTLRPDSLHTWNWDWPAGAGTYSALYPRAWFEYEWDQVPLRLIQMELSPVLPHNYRESSFPVAVFEWRIENPTPQPLRVGLMFTWQNLLGWGWGEEPPAGRTHDLRQLEEAIGIELTRQGEPVSEEWDGSFAIATRPGPDLTVTYTTGFDPDDGADVWADFAQDGVLQSSEPTTSVASSADLAAALAVTFDLLPGETRLLPFALAWDFPIVEFGSGTQWYKRYTRFYGTSGRAAFQIAADALADYPTWLEALEAWQAPILDDPRLPTWYKTALFNELYVLADGGSMWEAGRVGGPSSDEPGSFAYLECFDYPFYNTFDVHFYASFALVQLWPELELRLIRDIAAVVNQATSEQTVTIASTGTVVPRHLAGSVPHDLGGPDGDPWLMPNAYVWRDVGLWRDLNSKFVLQVWRDEVYTGDPRLLEDTWPAVVTALDYLHAFDLDHDGLPDHTGTPDQTYDDWVMQGASAYAGGLWLAALEAAQAMAQRRGDMQALQRYTAWLSQGQQSFERLLWNGRYYNFDSAGPHRESIMADQLAGQWYAAATGLPPIVPPDHVRTALQTIYHHNVLGFQGGQMGAVNGMLPDGTVDLSSDQSQEVWSGVTYALAASMLQQNLVDEAWATAWGAYHMTYDRGFWFRTPEAWDAQGNFRASMYMRPLSIWAIQAALQSVPEQAEP